MQSISFYDKFDFLQENYGNQGYTSARMKSKASWTYGRLQIRAKLPTGRGVWPGLWMVSILSVPSPKGNIPFFSK